MTMFILYIKICMYMRPEISDRNMDRLKEWARKHAGPRVERLGKRGGKSYYSVDDALDDLLKEAGF